MRFYLYGAGVYGEKAVTLIRRSYSGITIDGIIDQNKEGALCGIALCKPELVEKTSVVVICVKRFALAQEIFNNLKQNGFSNIFWYYKEKQVRSESFIEDQCVDGSLALSESAMAQVEMHIMDACNLNCRGCSHFSPIFDKTVPDFESRIKDVQMLSDRIQYIHEFYILGGEPFLNPDIAKYVTSIKAILPETELVIVTNGLLIPSIDRAILKTIRENNVLVSISEYQPVHKMIDRIVETLEENDVCYEIRSIDAKAVFNIPLTINANSAREKLCISDGCLTIWNGKIARCPTLMYIDKFNDYFGQNLPNQGVVELKDAPRNEDLIESLKRRVPLCSYCVKNPTEWRVCGKEPQLNDFATED